MRACRCIPLTALALLAASAAVAREPTPRHPAPVVLPASETFLLRPRDGGEPYRIWVALPRSYRREPQRRYPVVYQLDGDVGFATGAEVARFLALTREVPEVLLVGIGYGDDMDRWRARRVSDLTPVAEPSHPQAGKAERFLDFLASDLVPLVEHRYRTGPDRSLSGYSLGGLFATYVLFHRPGLFQRYLIGSPSYLYADSAALRWPATMGAQGGQPVGLVVTSFGTAEPPEEIGAWRRFWDEVEARSPPGLHVVRAEIDETHAAGAWVGLVKGLKAALAAPLPSASQGRTSDAPAARVALPGEPVTFRSQGSTLQGRFFRASEAGPRPTVLLLPGFPGEPGDVLGIGAAVSRAGWHALAFNPRGLQGSEGTHTLENSLEDTAAALSFLRNSAEPLGVDAGRIAAVGYSYGGWMAFMAGARHAEVKCVAGIGPANLGLQARLLDTDPAFAASLRQMIEGAARKNLVRGLGWEAAAVEMRAHADEYDQTRQAAALAGKPILVVGGWRDSGPTLEGYIVPLVRALRAAGNTRVTPATLDDDHVFRATRRELQRTVVSWLVSACTP